MQGIRYATDVQATRAEGEAATLMQVLGSAEGILERQTARGLATVSALFNIAGRVASPDLLRCVPPPPPPPTVQTSNLLKPQAIAR